MPEDSPLWSVLVLAGAQMRTLCEALADDPTVSLAYRREAAELSRLWDATAAELGRPRERILPVIYLAEEPLCEPTEEIAITDPAEPAESAPPSVDGPIVEAAPKAKRKSSPRMNEATFSMRERLIRQALQNGPLTIGKIAMAVGLDMSQVKRILREGGFHQNMQTKRWELKHGQET